MDWIKVFDNESKAREIIVADKPQLLILKGKRICLALHNNIFFAVQDSCSHSGESLNKGNINYLGEIICPLHNYRFNLQNGRECSSRSRDLSTFPIKIDESGFFVGI
jgi:3-phenylpropionate/trans-cinnamate dioxygenase ferredoxin component